MTHVSKDRLIRQKRQLTAALRKAGIPPSAVGIEGPEIMKMLDVSPEDKEWRALIQMIFMHMEKWQSNTIFIIEGGDAKQSGEMSPQDKRRQLGFSILSLGIIHAVQEVLPPFESVGCYIDFKHFVDSAKARYDSDLIDELASYRYLFLSEIWLGNTPPGLRDMITFKLDDLLRRRRDAELVTILSFRNFAVEELQQNTLGDEVRGLLIETVPFETKLLQAQRICKFQLSEAPSDVSWS
jgi:hypothetical protein